MLGTVVTGSDGHWSITTNNISNAVHTFTAFGIDRAGNVGSSSLALLGSSSGDKLSSVTAGELVVGGKGADQLTAGTGADTFVFHAGFAKDTIFGFDVVRDALGFDHNLFADVAEILSHTKDVKGNAVITYDAADTVTLIGVTKAQLEAHPSDLFII